MAALRNTVIGLMRWSGATNIAAATRRFAAQPLQALRLIGIGVWFGNPSYVGNLMVCEEGSSRFGSYRAIYEKSGYRWAKQKNDNRKRCSVITV